MSEIEVDVVVVGLGPGGEAVAQQLAKAGLEVVAIERHLVGGECPYYGCVPTKMMVRAAGALGEARRVSGLAGEATVVPSWAPVAARIRDEATDDWDDAVAVKRLEDAGATFVRGEGRLGGERRVEVEGQVYVARRAVVLNPGTAPAVLPVDGLAGTPYWTNRDAVRTTELPSSLAVVGGGAIGCELAQVFGRFGVQVTVVEAAPRLVALEEPEASDVVAAVFDREGIRVMAGARLASVQYADGLFRLDVDGENVAVDKVLVAAGRTPQLAGLGLESAGLDPSARVLETDEAMRLHVGGAPSSWLYAVGDVTGRGAWTHMSMLEADLVVGDVLGRSGPAPDFRAVSRVTFTDPEVGSVGLTEQQARDAGLDVRTSLAPLAQSSRGWIHQAGNDGFVKLVAGGDVLVGATSVGPAGGEVLAMLTLAVHAKVPIERLRTMVYAYPTFHRAVKDAVDQLT